MQVIKLKQKLDIMSLGADFDFSSSGAVTALGFFDGVHIAHRALIGEARKIADKRNLPLVIFTFSGESELLKASSKRLFTDEERLSLLEECGADFTVIADFSIFRMLTAEEFVNGFLIDTLNTKTAVCGFNFRFGKDAAGTADELCRFMKIAGRETEIFGEYLYESKTLSSTYIRSLLSEKKLKEAAALLGKPYFISGKVSHGLGLGKGLGIPTINTELPKERFILPFGVYLTAIKIENKVYKGLTNIGSCPTFEERAAHTETFILDFDGNLYGQEVRIYFLEFLRDEKKFSSAEELLMQINVDKNKAFELLGELKWQELGLN